jgi:hypothetical protein
MLPAKSAILVMSGLVLAHSQMPKPAIKLCGEVKQHRHKLSWLI